MHFKKGSNQNDNNVRLPTIKADKRPRAIAANEKLTNNKLLLASTKLVQDKLLFNSAEAKSVKNSSNHDDNDIRLLPIRVGKWPMIAAANRKAANSKLLLALTKLGLGIGQDMIVKKIITLKTG